MALVAPPVAKRDLFEPEHHDYRESFRKFLAAEVQPHVDQWERDQIVPRELFTKAAAHGFLAMEVPEQYGGSGVADWRFNVVLGEEIAYTGVGAAFAGPLLHTDVCVPYLMASATERQRQRWLPGVASGERILAIAMTEPGTGSDLAAIQTRAVRDGEDFIVNGAKTFITNGILADLVIVAARTSDEKQPDDSCAAQSSEAGTAGEARGRRARGRHEGLSLFVVEREMAGFERGKQIQKLGQHASDTAELFFSDVRVPAENMLGAEGSGFLQLVSRLVPERLTLAVGAIAGCEAAFATTLAYIKERKAFGRPIGSFQHSRFLMAELRTKIEITRAFVDRTIQRYVDGTATVEEAAMAKWWTTDLLCAVTDAGVQLHGGYGYTTEYAIGRAWVDARITKIYAGTNEIMKELIGRTMGL